jgi:Mg2+ and Co2+ transporter CorA
MSADFYSLIAVVIVNLLGLGALWGKIRQEVTALAEKHMEIKQWAREEIEEVEDGYRSGLTRVDNRVQSLENKIFDSRGKANFMDVDELRKFENVLTSTAMETRELTKSLVTGLTGTIEKYYATAARERKEQRERIGKLEARMTEAEQFCKHQHKGSN